MFHLARNFTSFRGHLLTVSVSRAGLASLILVLYSAVAVADHTPDQEAEQSPAIEWQIESSHSTLSNREQDVFLRIRVQATNAKSETRQPLSVSFVFDRSGSMKEESKIGYVQQAGHLVTDNLTSDDHVAFVAYSDRVHVLVPLHRVVNREYLHHRIDELFASGHTNLSAGILEGCAQLHKRLNEPGLHHVILLTDGLANRGVTNTQSLVRLVKRCTQHGITLTTIGVGTEYNEQLLSRVAQAGGGRYIYVSEPDQIPAAFQRELGSLLAVVAQNVPWKMQLPAGVEVRQVYGREEPLKPDELEIPLGDLTSGEERVLLIKFRAAATGGASAIDLPVQLIYDDIANASRIEDQQVASLQQVAAEATISLKPSPVLTYARLVESVDKIAMAVQSMDRKLTAEVLDIRQRQYPAWKQIARDSRDQDFYNKAFMFEHYSRELQDLVGRGDLHEHNEERAQLQKELHYRRYMLQHHQHGH